MAHGAIFVEELSEVPDDSIADLLCSRCLSKRFRKEAKERELTVFDATAPFSNQSTYGSCSVVASIWK